MNSTHAAHPKFFSQLLWKTGLLYEVWRQPLNMCRRHSGEVDV